MRFGMRQRGEGKGRLESRSALLGFPQLTPFFLLCKITHPTIHSAPFVLARPCVRRGTSMAAEEAVDVAAVGCNKTGKTVAWQRHGMPGHDLIGERSLSFFDEGGSCLMGRPLPVLSPLPSDHRVHVFVY